MYSSEKNQNQELYCDTIKEKKAYYEGYTT